MEALKACTTLVQQAISSQASCITSGDFQTFLGNFTQLLKHSDCRLHVQCRLRGGYCLYCDMYIPSTGLKDAVGLWCSPNEHFFCSKDCFKKHVLISTNQTLMDLDQVLCPYCNERLDMGQINEVFDGRILELQQDACDRALLNLLDEEDKERMRARFTCMICFNELKVEEGITLECDHRFCADCITQHVQILVDSADVSDDKLKCPNCDQPLTVYELEEILTPAQFDKYEKFKLRGLGFNNELAGSGVIYHCQGTDCEYLCILDKNEVDFECPQCKHKCCPQCNEEPHKNSTCEEYKQWKIDNGMVEEKLDELLEQEGLLKCPECGAIVERISGCQFMVCSSSKCQRRTFFCYECGIKLAADHAPHDCKPRWKNGVRPPAPGLFGAINNNLFAQRAVPRRRRAPVQRRRRRK